MQKNYFSFLLLLIVSLLVVSCVDPIDPEDKPTPITPVSPVEFDLTKDSFTLKHEFRGAWIATVYSLDWPISKNVPEQKAELRNIFSNLKKANFNAVVFQVISMADAMFKSDYLPWAKQLTGVSQGTDPGYDPLAYAVEIAKEFGLELHAWINPLRIGKKSELCDNHPAILNPEWSQTYKDNLYWDPAVPEFRQFLSNIVTELMTNYDIDGIHIDDYFYPSGLKNNNDTWDDTKMFQLYGSDKTLNVWREENIDKIVQGLYNSVKSVDPTALFGVSPQGKLENTRALYADPITWMKEGYIDYLTPQIYWYIGHKSSDFKNLAYSWAEQSYKVPVIPGLAAYRLEESGFSLDEFVNQVTLCRNIDKIQGNIWFRTQNILSYNFPFVSPTESFNIYQYPALRPTFACDSTISLDTPQVKVTVNDLSWNSVENAEAYAVYKLKYISKNIWEPQMVSYTTQTKFKGEGESNYFVIAVNGRVKSEYDKVHFIP